MNQILAVATIILAFATQAVCQTNPDTVKSQASGPTLAERLGYPRDAKLLIVNTDDLGMAHSIDAASIKAFSTGMVTSGSIMVPCPWLPEIANYARSHPDADLGLHLTLTSEWAHYRWGPVLGKDKVPSLFDPAGYLYPAEDVAAAHIDPHEAEAEIRAQIERAKAFGIQPTHLDSHMGTLYQNKALFEVLLRVAREHKLPVRIAREWRNRAPYFESVIKPDDILLDSSVTIGDDVPEDQWVQFYTGAIKSLKPGVTEFGIHLAYDDEEMRNVAFEHPGWGARWRQRDFDFFTSDTFRQLLKENGVTLIKWSAIRDLLSKPSGRNL